MKTILPTLLSLVLLLGTTGCNKIEKDWKKAEEAKTTEAYQAFIQAHPDSPHVVQAGERIRLLAWARALAAKDPQAIERYLGDYPSAPNREEARKTVDELSWGLANAAGALSAYEGYTTRYPAGLHHAEATRKISELSWEAARAKNTAAAYRDFVTRFGESPRLAEAKSALAEAMAAEDFSHFEAKVMSFLNGTEASNFIRQIGNRVFGEERIGGGGFWLSPGSQIRQGLGQDGKPIFLVSAVMGESNQIAAVTGIEVKEDAVIVFTNGNSYVYQGGKWSPKQPAPADGK